MIIHYLETIVELLVGQVILNRRREIDLLRRVDVLRNTYEEGSTSKGEVMMKIMKVFEEITNAINEVTVAISENIPDELIKQTKFFNDFILK